MKTRTTAMLVLAGIGVIIIAVLLKLSRWNDRVTEPSHGPIKSEAGATAKSNHWKSNSKMVLPTLDDEEMKRMLGTEAVFYGKVVDQYGNGVPNAGIGFHRLPIGGENPGLIPPLEMIADSTGSFTLRQAKTPSLAIGVNPPPGYYSTEDSIVKYFHFYQPPDSLLALLPERDQIINRAFVADPNNPVIFKLKKMGHTDPMIYRHKSVVVKAEQDILIGSNPSHTLRVKYRLDPNAKRIELPHGGVMYDWGFELSVPGGGLVLRKDPESKEASSFEAPENGYEEKITNEYNISMSLSEYQRSVNREYFARFSDDTHARVLINMDSGPKRPFMTIESWFNPSGNRSTEFDTSKAIEVPPVK